MVNTLVGAFTVPQTACGGVPCLSGLNWARFDFSDSSAFSGEAKGDGFAGKIGGVYKVNDAVSIGATYHSKTSLGDLETKGATLSMNVVGPATLNNQTTIPVSGKISVKDFQWPQTIGAGVAYQATPELVLVFDYKWINWADVMKSFKMTFTADANQGNAAASSFGLGGQVVDAELTQNWKDQHVFMIGAGYMVSPDWMLRTGLNYANNPIPDTYLNALFPAIETTHITLGAGYMISKASTVDASFTYAPEVKQTSGANAPEGATVTHSQTNVQVMLSYRF
jgi:long-chain fatty acid transport protein